MYLLGKVISVGLVWMAAGATLFAGVPFTACRCLAGAAESPSSHKSADTHRSCCGTGCCATSGAYSCCRGRAASQATPKPCCANRHAASQPPSSEGTPALSGTCCVRTTHQPDAPLFNPNDLTARHDFSAHLMPLAIVPAPVAPLTPPSAVAGTGPGHSLSPPPDLLSLLQHLLI
jgi:hypothetical protein